MEYLSVIMLAWLRFIHALLARICRNPAYWRYLHKIGKAKDNRSFEIDAGKGTEEARCDGIFVLRTNAKVTPLQAVLRYRDFLQVESLLAHEGDPAHAADLSFIRA